MSDRKAMPEPSMDEILAKIRRILADDQHAGRAAGPPRAENDVLDLTEALNEDGTVRHITPIRLVPAEPASGPGSVRREPVPPRAAGPRLVSDAASEAVAASFARLADAQQTDGEPSVDELVRETLRPLLQAWLDANLPALVERLVRAEIARVVGNRAGAQ